jgi:hypothetical protein
MDPFRVNSFIPVHIIAQPFSQNNQLSESPSSEMISKTAGLLAGLLLADSAHAESMYNPQKSNVTIYNSKNFDKQVLKNREKGISVVQFYKDDGKLCIAASSES